MFIGFLIFFMPKIRLMSENLNFNNDFFGSLRLIGRVFVTLSV
jgi:hypothetical protein